MKKGLITISLLIFSAVCFSQKKDSTRLLVISGFGAHNGVCCNSYSDTIIQHYSYERKEWSLMTDSFYRVYYHRSDSIKSLKKNRTYKSATQENIIKGIFVGK